MDKRASLYILIGMAIWGTIPLFARAVNLPSAEIAFWRAALAVVFIGAYVLFKRERLTFDAVRKELPWLLASGIAIGVNWVFMFEAYRYTTVSVAAMSYYFAPVLVTLACPFLFGERMTVMKIICFAGSTLGLVFVINPGGLEAGGTHLKGVLFGLGAAVLYAGVVLINKKIQGTSGLSGIHRTLLQFVAATIILAPYVLMTDGINLAQLSGLGWASIITLGLVHTGIVYCIYFSVLPHVAGQRVAILSYIDPLVSVILSVTVLGEPIAAIQVLGGIMILGFTLANELAENSS